MLLGEETAELGGNFCLAALDIVLLATALLLVVGLYDASEVFELTALVWSLPMVPEVLRVAVLLLLPAGLEEASEVFELMAFV